MQRCFLLGRDVYTRGNPGVIVFLDNLAVKGSFHSGKTPMHMNLACFIAFSFFYGDFDDS